MGVMLKKPYEDERGQSMVIVVFTPSISSGMALMAAECFWEDNVETLRRDIRIILFEETFVQTCWLDGDKIGFEYFAYEDFTSPADVRVDGHPIKGTSRKLHPDENWISVMAGILDGYDKLGFMRVPLILDIPKGVELPG